MSECVHLVSEQFTAMFRRKVSECVQQFTAMFRRKVSECVQQFTAMFRRKVNALSLRPVDVSRFGLMVWLITMTSVRFRFSCPLSSKPVVYKHSLGVKKEVRL